MARERRLLWPELASKFEKYAILAETPASATTITSAMASQIRSLREDKDEDRDEDKDKDKDEDKDKDLQPKSNQAMDN